MPFSHHSHSGQFCPGHAKDSLEEIVQRAVDLNMQVFALTEHMPREERDFYPEEIEAKSTETTLLEYHDGFYNEAMRLREKYKDKIDILIGLESDWIRGASREFIESLLSQHRFDFYVSSVHHVHAIPIDFDTPFYLQAREVSGGKDEILFKDYFEAQFAMLESLKPPVIGHFDLIRLKSDDPDGSFRQYNTVWSRIVRNLEYIASYGGILELNFASIRKGLREPYPNLEICKVFLGKGGRFCLSDDSHGVDQVALNFQRVPHFLGQAGIKTMHYFQRSDKPLKEPIFPSFPNTYIKSVDTEEFKRHRFWS